MIRMMSLLFVANLGCRGCREWFARRRKGCFLCCICRYIHFPLFLALLNNLCTITIFNSMSNFHCICLCIYLDFRFSCVARIFYSFASYAQIMNIHFWPRQLDYHFFLTSRIRICNCQRYEENYKAN